MSASIGTRGVAPPSSRNARRAIVWLALAWLPWCAGCGALTGTSEEDSGGGSGASADWLDTDATEEERKFLEAARPFVLAVVANQPDAAYGCLSSHATARITLNQFAPAEDDAEQARREQNAMLNVTAPQFAELFQQTVAAYGIPHEADYLAVESTDPSILAGEAGDDLGSQLEVSLAVGGVPDSLPKDIRRAALRGRVSTQYAPEQLQHMAQELGLTPEEFAVEVEGAKPYFNLHLIVVEEGAQLKIGYFAFQPPSILD